jgi:tRNA nucleotidyltransferase (CCA-adding enzyme)
MAIPESQLETWSHQGSITQSSNTYNTIKNVLEGSTTPYANKNFKVFLQGSYGNDTNIYAESDVDIVIRLDDCFHSDLKSLSEDEKSEVAPFV